MTTENSHTEYPDLSIVVIFHEMRREAYRTLFSLGGKFQERVEELQYEVIAIDNGSRNALGSQFVAQFGEKFRYEYIDTQSVSPAAAVNKGVQIAKGKYVAIIVDGARMASPGLISRTLTAAMGLSNPVVFSLAWHLGPQVQNISMLSGYDQSVEDELLDSIDWRRNGRKLFDIAVLAQSSKGGFLGGIPSEFSWFCLKKELFAHLGGFNEEFISRGGGMVNHDFRNRLISTPGAEPLMILGDGVFHQFHGGVATNVPMDQHPQQEFRSEYERIHGRPYQPVSAPEPLYFGTMPDNARKFLCC